MKNKSIIKFYLISIIISTISYILMIYLKPLNVVFLDGSLGLIFSFIFTIILLNISSKTFSHNKKKILEFLSIVIISSSSFFALLTFHTLFIVSLDRSISVYALSYLMTYYKNSEFNDQIINDIIKDGFLEGDIAAKRRINEQIKIGYFERLENGNLILTRKAIRFIKNSRFIASKLNLNKKIKY